MLILKNPENPVLSPDYEDIWNCVAGILNC